MTKPEDGVLYVVEAQHKDGNWGPAWTTGGGGFLTPGEAKFAASMLVKFRGIGADQVRVVRYVREVKL